MVRLTQGSPTGLVSNAVRDTIKLSRLGEPEAAKGSEGGRFTGSTEDSGPMKPGNSVEEKTLTTREVLRIYLVPNLGVPISSLGHGKPWTRGDSDSVRKSN